jgi:putative PIN family toxin of toxin-antitoxin system
LRFVLDVNVFISALLSRTGAPARLLERWLEGELELVVCEKLLEELERALRSPKLSNRAAERDTRDFLALVRDLGELVPDPTDPPPIRSQDPNDDYLIALAAREHVRLVSGDSHLLALSEAIPVSSPRAALNLLD